MTERKVVLSDGTVAYISNRTADGTVRDSMKDYPVLYNETTDIAYRVLATCVQRAVAQEKKKSAEKVSS